MLTNHAYYFWINNSDVQCVAECIYFCWLVPSVRIYRSYSLALLFEKSLLKKQTRCFSWLYICMEICTSFCWIQVGLLPFSCISHNTKMRNGKSYVLNTIASLFLFYHDLEIIHSNIRNKQVRLQGMSHFKSSCFDFPNQSPWEIIN